MKRKYLLIIMLAAIFALGGCNKQDLSFSGAYWNSNPQNKSVSAITEELTYKVTTVGKAEFSSSEASDGELALVIDSASYYKTKLSVDNGNYVYETTLFITGKYTYGDKEYTLEGDSTYTRTVFKGLEERLAPISSYRKVNNVYPSKEEPTSAEDFKKIAYEMTVNYGDKAEIKITPASGSEEFFSFTERAVDGYKSATFFDEDEMIFAIRAMKLTDGCNFDFGTIDGLSGEYRQIRAQDIATTYERDESGKQPLTPITIANFREGGKLSDKREFSTYGVAFKTVGNYGKIFRYVYYAVNTTESNSTRQVPVKIYQPMLYGGKYLCFTLSETATV